MVRMDHYRNACEHSRDSTERSGFRRMSMNHLRTLFPKKPEQTPESLQIGERTDRPSHLRNVSDLHAALLGVIGHIPFFFFDEPGNEPRAPRPLVEGGSQVRDVHGRAAHVEAGNDTVDENRLERRRDHSTAWAALV